MKTVYNVNPFVRSCLRIGTKRYGQIFLRKEYEIKSPTIMCLDERKGKVRLAPLLVWMCNTEEGKERGEH